MRKFITTGAALLAATVLLGMTACTEPSESTEGGLETSPEVACLVDDKDRSTDAEGKSVYRIYSSCGVFNVEDALFLGVFNAADTYAGIQPGKTYDFTTYGFRNGLFSMFPNITKAVETLP